jgi:AmiR/NasT family two-component response regulator
MRAGGAQDEVDRLRSEIDHLQTALASRDVIGQAKGILMERHGIDADEAFERLVRISQTTNTKLHAVAATVAERAGEPGGDGHRPATLDAEPTAVD